MFMFKLEFAPVAIQVSLCEYPIRCVNILNWSHMYAIQHTALFILFKKLCIKEDE